MLGSPNCGTVERSRCGSDRPRRCARWRDCRSRLRSRWRARPGSGRRRAAAARGRAHAAGDHEAVAERADRGGAGDVSCCRRRGCSPSARTHGGRGSEHPHRPGCPTRSAPAPAGLSARRSFRRCSLPSRRSRWWRGRARSRGREGQRQAEEQGVTRRVAGRRARRSCAATAVLLLRGHVGGDRLPSTTRPLDDAHLDARRPRRRGERKTVAHRGHVPAEAAVE